MRIAVSIVTINFLVTLPIACMQKQSRQQPPQDPLSKYPQLVQKIATWQAIIREAARVIPGLEAESKRRINASLLGIGTLEYQYITPWRDNWEVCEKLAGAGAAFYALSKAEHEALATEGAGTSKSTYSIVSDSLHNLKRKWDDNEYNWHNIIYPAFENLFETVGSAIKKQEEAASWAKRSLEVPQQQAAQHMHSAYAALDETKQLARYHAEQLKKQMIYKDTTALRNLCEALPRYRFRENIASYLTLEFLTKAIVAATCEITDQLDVHPIRRDRTKLAMLADHLAHFKAQSQQLNANALKQQHMDRIVSSANEASNILTVLQGTMRTVQETTDYVQQEAASIPRPLQQPAPDLPARPTTTTTTTQQTTTNNALPAYVEQLLTAQQQQIAQLLKQQAQQQEQMNQLQQMLLQVLSHHTHHKSTEK